MLAQHRGHFDVKIVERDDAVYPFRVGEMGGTLPDVGVRHIAAHVEELVDRLARPVGVAQPFLRQQQDPVPLPAALAQEFVPLQIGRDAEQRQRHMNVTISLDRRRTSRRRESSLATGSLSAVSDRWCKG